MARTATSLLALLLSLGCSSSEPGPGASADPLRTESAFCAEWAKVACNDQVVEDCGGTDSGCRESQEIACGDLIPFGYSSKHARDCLDAVRDAYEDSVLTAEELHVIRDLTGECGRLVAGSVEEGDSCVENSQCNTVDGYACVKKPNDVEGTCQEPVEGSGGDDCSEPQVVCPENQYCAALAEEGAGSACVARKREDASCAVDEECQSGLRCVVAVDEAMGTCVPRIGSGDSCTSDQECVTGLCVGAAPICLTQVRLTGESVLCQELR